LRWTDRTDRTDSRQGLWDREKKKRDAGRGKAREDME